MQLHSKSVQHNQIVKFRSVIRRRINVLESVKNTEFNIDNLDLYRTFSNNADVQEILTQKLSPQLKIIEKQKKEQMKRE